MERQENGMPKAYEEKGAQNGSMCQGRRQLASVYAPIQKWQMLFPTDKALSHGTLFEELYMPLEVERDG